ncbi:Fc.00g002610.m01.CDS01 [Cosmosporella sp. VM-42]
MGKRKDRRETSCLSASPPTTTTKLTRPTTPTSPVKIPTSNSKRGSFAHAQKRHASQRSRRRDTHDADSISPSLAALLAVTDIPRPRQMQRRRRRSDKPLTLDEIIDSNQGSEKDLSWSLSKNPLDMLLSPPEDVADNDDESVSDCNIGSALSTRTMSVDSIPSLGESFTSDPLSSLDTPRTPSPYRGRRFSPMRKSLQPIISPPGTIDEHPLAGENVDVGDLDFEVFQRPEPKPAKSQLLQPFKPLKFAFKSNLTASLRALRSAAKSFSAINFPSIPPDDFLTRSILTIDPNVPYTDERRPPVSEDIPSAEMRRYLNPTSNARIEAPASKVTAGTFAASIQMRTYKIQRSRSAPPPSRSPYPSTSLQTTPEPQQPQPEATNQAPPTSPPGMRQREMRENSDFIRVAVMEMAMRKRGKLDDQRPGRARWALPPMKMSSKPYELTAEGVPVRWIAVNY